MFDEIKFRYRALSLGFRLFIVVLCALIPGLLTYLDNAPILEAELQSAQTAEAAARENLAKANAQVKNLPEMESKLAFTSEQLKKAEEVLPSSVLIDEVIESVGKHAKEADVFLKNFAPLGEKTIAGDYPYDEIRFKITMGGKFANLTKWMDLLAGSETKGYVKSLEFKRGVSLATRRLIQEMNQPKSGQDEADEVKKIESAYEKAIKGRDDYALDLVTEVVYYRGSTNIPSPTGAVDPKAIPPVQTGFNPAAQDGENGMGSVTESTSHNIALGVMQK